MNLNYQTILARANALYKEAKSSKLPDYQVNKELEIESDQVKSILQALIEELNK
jgi:hypothetical protein